MDKVEFNIGDRFHCHYGGKDRMDCVVLEIVHTGAIRVQLDDGEGGKMFRCFSPEEIDFIVR